MKTPLSLAASNHYKKKHIMRKHQTCFDMQNAMTSVSILYLLGMRLLQTLILLSVRFQLSSGELSLVSRDTYGE